MTGAESAAFEFVGAAPVLLALWPLYRGVTVRLEKIETALRDLAATDEELVTATERNSGRIESIEDRIPHLIGVKV